MQGLKGVEWRTVSMKTLGFLAAKGKISLLQIHSLIGDKADKVFRDTFLGTVNLRKPTDADMTQINMFSHMLF